MHPNDGGRKRTPAPYVRPPPQHLTTPTLFHQTDGSNSAPSFVRPTLASVNYFTDSPREYAPVTGSYPQHPSLKIDSSHSHNSIYQQHAGTLQSLHSAGPVSAGVWPEASPTVQPPYQMDGINGRHEEDAALWHSFLNEPTLRPPLASGEPPQTYSRPTSLPPLHPPSTYHDGPRMSQRATKRKRLTHRTASVEEDSPESDDGQPDPAAKR